MCGISGFNWPDRDLIGRMNEALAHRGPDDTGIWVGDSVSLGHQRLAILDLSEKGRQPMTFEDLTITYNGEIYNYPALKQDLSALGYVFRSTSDTEVILAAYHKWGAACVKKFNGIFSLAIWDGGKKELFLARDHLGIKPLYYYHAGDKFIFASEIKAILQHPIPRKVDIGSLNFLLKILYVPEPDTMFEQIKKLPAGHYAHYRGNTLKLFKYWTPAHIVPEDQSTAAWEENIRSLLKDSVKQQLISDRPLGVFLSGGWDSSTILGVMRELGIAKIKTFSSGFETSNPKYNRDMQLAKATARFYATDHNEVCLPADSVSEIFDKVIAHLDEPNASPTTLPMYYLSKFTKEKVTVLLGGDGGDELFAGYPRYRQSFYLDKFQKLPAFLRGLVPYFLLQTLTGKNDLKRKLNVPPGYARFAMFKVYPAEKIHKLLTAARRREEIPERYFREKYFSNERYADFTNLLMLLDLENWLVAESLWKTDRMTAAMGLEERLPFLDWRLVELSRKISSSLKVRNFQSKWIFKRAVDRYIPPHLKRAKKMGWLTPGNQWLKRELMPLAESVFAGEYSKDLGNYFDLNFARDLYQAHRSGNSMHMNQLWAMLTFAVWYEKYLK